MIKRFLFLSGLFFIFFAAPSQAAPVKPVSPMVRVLVAENQKLFFVSVKGPYVIRALPSMAMIKKGPSVLNLPLTASPIGLRLGDQAFPVKALRIEQAGERDLFLNKSRFRGAVDVVRDDTGLLRAVNRVDLEGYLYGVLHHEVNSWWPMEALKAQAVAARTYALYEVEVNKIHEFDLKSGTNSQVYGGSTTERSRTKSAVDKTAGQVLTYQGKVFPAYFNATCAGTTAGAQELWKINLPPLSGGVVCNYCKISPHYFWHARIPLSDIEEKLNKNGRPLGQILNIQVISLTPSGRVGSLKITGTQREDVIAAKDFRVWIGGDKMKSTAFTLRVADDMAYFQGKGWGHGVGLCQWGTLGQALLGRKYDTILKFYYPGSEITTLSDPSAVPPPYRPT